MLMAMNVGAMLRARRKKAPRSAAEPRSLTRPAASLGCQLLDAVSVCFYKNIPIYIIHVHACVWAFAAAYIVSVVICDKIDALPRDGRDTKA